MSAGSKISWTSATWNPTTGCDQVSPGCDHCYALTLAARLKRMGNVRYQNDGSPKTSGPGFALTLHHDKLGEPLKWKKPRRIFVNSMSDLFHDDVPDSFIGDVWTTMADTPQHVYQILTKRPRRMARFMQGYVNDLGYENAVLPNVWLGTSVEDQKRADLRIPLLLETPAAVRFLSCEPLLGPVDLDTIPTPHGRCECGPGGDQGLHEPWCGTMSALREGIDWVIAGGESGPDYREMNPDWARSLRDQCVAAGVPFFFKQGSGPRSEMHKELDGRTWDEMPERVSA